MVKLDESQKMAIKEMIADKLVLSVEDVLDCSKLSYDLGADSLDAMELIVDLEIMFDISIPDEDYDHHMDINKIYEIVERYIQ